MRTIIVKATFKKEIDRDSLEYRKNLYLSDCNLEDLKVRHIYATKDTLVITNYDAKKYDKYDYNDTFVELLNVCSLTQFR